MKTQTPTKPNNATQQLLHEMHQLREINELLLDFEMQKQSTARYRFRLLIGLLAFSTMVMIVGAFHGLMFTGTAVMTTAVLFCLMLWHMPQGR
jgi:hypothetical protein